MAALTRRSGSRSVTRAFWQEKEGGREGGREGGLNGSQLFIHPLAGIDLVHGRLDSQVGLQVHDKGVLERKEGGGEGGREGGREG